MAVVLFAAACMGSVRANVPVATMGAIQQYLATTLDSECPAPGGPPSGPAIAIGSPDSVSIASVGSAEYLVQGRFGCFCDITGNCALWVLESSGATFRILLEAVGTRIVPLHATSHDHPDLEVTMIESMTVDMTVVYQFDGQIYRKTQCTFMNSENGKKPACR